MTLFTVLFAIVLIGLMHNLAGCIWSEILQRKQPPGTTLPPPPKNSNNP